MRTLPLSLPFARYFRFLVLFTARRNALIASAVLAIATPSVRLSVCIDEVRTLPLSIPFARYFRFLVFTARAMLALQALY